MEWSRSKGFSRIIAQRTESQKPKDEYDWAKVHGFVSHYELRNCPGIGESRTFTLIFEEDVIETEILRYLGA